jgi:hypothetical protein
VTVVGADAALGMGAEVELELAVSRTGGSCASSGVNSDGISWNSSEHNNGWLVVGPSSKSEKRRERGSKQRQGLRERRSHCRRLPNS